MEYSVAYNGLKFSGTPIETFVGGKDGLNKTPGATKTSVASQQLSPITIGVALMVKC